jgi:hypothetical protein
METYTIAFMFLLWFSTHIRSQRALPVRISE